MILLNIVNLIDIFKNHHSKEINIMKDTIKKHEYVIKTELKHKLKDKFKVELSRFHINRIVNDNNIT